MIEKLVLICGVAMNEEIVKGWWRCKKLQFIVKKRDHYQQRGPNNSGMASHDEGKEFMRPIENNEIHWVFPILL